MLLSNLPQSNSLMFVMDNLSTFLRATYIHSHFSLLKSKQFHTTLHFQEFNKRVLYLSVKWMIAKIFNNPCKIFNKTGGGKLVTFNSSPRFNLIPEQPEKIIVPANRIFALLFCIPLREAQLSSCLLRCDSSLLHLGNFRSFYPDLGCSLFRQKEKKIPYG